MKRYYCGVGPREIPEDVCERMTKLASILERKGWVLRSGGAKGADKAFEKGIKDRVNKKEIFLGNCETPMWTNIFTDFFHPNPPALTPNARNLMNRNALQILGLDGNSPVEFIVCWTKNGKMVGGTAQAMRIAKYFNIPIYNFFREEDIDSLKKLIKEMR